MENFSSDEGAKEVLSTSSSSQSHTETLSSSSPSVEEELSETDSVDNSYKVEPVSNTDNEDSEISQSEDSSESEGSENDTDSDAASDVQIDYQIHNMHPNNYKQILAFLQMTFYNKVTALKGGDCGLVDIGAISRIICDVLCEYVGNVAVDEGGGEENNENSSVYGFISMVPFNLNDFGDANIEQDDLKAIKDLRTILLDTARKSLRCLSKTQKSAVEAAFQEWECTAVIFSERFLNTPAQISIPLYEQLLDDLPAAIEESSSFAPSTILFISSLSESDGNQDYNGQKDGDESDGDLVQIHQENNAKRSKVDTLTYVYDEHEYLEEFATCWWDFKIREEADRDRGVKVARRVFMMTVDSLKAAVNKMKSIMSN